MKPRPIRSLKQLFDLADDRRCVLIPFGPIYVRKPASFVANMPARYITDMIAMRRLYIYTPKHKPKRLDRFERAVRKIQGSKGRYYMFMRNVNEDVSGPTKLACALEWCKRNNKDYSKY